MADEIAFENGRISNFEGLMTLTVGHTAYCRASLIDLYIRVIFHWNGRNFLSTDVRTCGQTFETGFIRSTAEEST